MTDDEKKALQIGADALVKPVGNIIDKLLGGPAEEIGGMWQDDLKVRRNLRRLKLIQKFQRKVEEAGFQPCDFPDSILVPALQAATLQDDDDMQELWAALLANAADPRHEVNVSPTFPEILKQLSSREAKLLNALWEYVRSDVERSLGNSGLSATVLKYTKIEWTIPMMKYGEIGLTRQPSEKLYLMNTDTDPKVCAEIEADRSEYELSMANLIRQRLLEAVTEPQLQRKFTGQRPKPGEQVELELKFETHYLLTALGFEFVRACRPPSPYES